MSRSILMLEYDDDDRYITQSVFEENKYDIQITFVNNGGEMLSHLEKADQKKSLPSLILMTYHAGPSNALPIIRDLKNHESYRHIPVVVLTGLLNDTIVKDCYRAGACSVIMKPSGSNETDVKISNFFRYWFETVELL